MEKLNITSRPRTVASPVAVRSLASLDGPAVDTDLVTRLKAVQAENNKLRAQFERLQATSQAAMRQSSTLRESKASLEASLTAGQGEVKTLMASQDAGSRAALTKLSKAREQLRQLEQKIDNASSEMDGKISNSSQFRTIHAMIATKSGQIKALRAQVEEKKQG